MPTTNISDPSIRGPQSLRLHSLISARADESPESIAVAAPGRVPLTYGGLCAHIDNIVKTMNAMGIGRDDRVAIVLPNGPEMAVAFLAVTAGATSAPLNPGYRASEYDFYLSDLNVRALIVQSGVDSPARGVAQGRDIPVIELSPVLKAEAGIFELIGDEHPRSADIGFAQPDDVALVMHTSGTTSRPKIVPLTHINICTSAHNIQATLGLVASDRCLNVMPLFHIHGLIGALLSSLSAGASVVCTPNFHSFMFFKWLAEFRPTWYSAVPTMHQSLLAQAEANRKTIARYPLRFIRSSSAPLPPRVMTGLENVFKCPVIESYGMTEASHQMASNPMPPGKRKAGSVGLAAGPEIAIMDETGNLLPSGKAGEIVIRGANVMRGYENNPEANERSFTNGWFRTGDQGYLDDDNYLFITGRLKGIINRGGEKISPREIDEVLMEHPAIAQAVTFAVPHNRLGEDVAAAVVLNDGTSATEGGIQEFTASRLADFKIPRRVLILNRIPEGPTGKLQRIGLAEKLGLTASDETESDAKAEYVAPRTPIEEKLAGIWSQVLGIRRVGIRDNFLHLGGDSILAAQIVSQVREVMQVGSFPLFAFFQAPTIEQIAGILSQKGWSPSWSSLVPIQPGGSKRPLFCIHTCVCEVLNYNTLARHLGADQPFYALRAQGIYGENAPHTRIEDMAAHYIEEIQIVQPEGPYFIAGGGPGGRIAFEMAQQLLSRGQKVGSLVLMDSFSHGLPIQEGSSAENTSAKDSPAGSLSVGNPMRKDRLNISRSRKTLFHYIRRSFYHLRRGQLHRILRDILKNAFDKYSWELAYSFLPRRINFIRLRINYNKRTRTVLSRASVKYVPKVYPGRVTYFLSEGLKDYFDEVWYKLAGGGLDLHVVPGFHLEMLREPHVRVLAEQLKSCLDEAQLNIPTSESFI